MEPQRSGTASRGTREGNPSLRKGGPTPLSAQLHPRQPFIEGEDKALDIKSSKNHCTSIEVETVATKYVNPWNLTAEQFFNLPWPYRLISMETITLPTFRRQRSIKFLSNYFRTVTSLDKLFAITGERDVIRARRKNSCSLHQQVRGDDIKNLCARRKNTYTTMCVYMHAGRSAAHVNATLFCGLQKHFSRGIPVYA